jgi:hypothetical protein
MALSLGLGAALSPGAATVLVTSGAATLEVSFGTPSSFGPIKASFALAVGTRAAAGALLSAGPEAESTLSGGSVTGTSEQLAVVSELSSSGRTMSARATTNLSGSILSGSILSEFIITYTIFLVQSDLLGTYRTQLIVLMISRTKAPYCIFLV